MKKVLAVLGVLFLGMLLLCGGVLFWSFRTGSQAQEKFFSAVSSGDTKQVVDQLHPAMMDQIDEPVLGAWMKAVKTNLGSFQGLGASNFNTSSNYENGQWITKSNGTVNFELGDATSNLVFQDGLITSFLIESDKLPKGWFQGPEDTTIYRQRGEAFLSAMHSSEADAAFEMMHSALQEAVSRKQLSEIAAAITEARGPVKSIAFKNESFSTDGTEKLTIYFDVTCENDTAVAALDFQFIGLKGHLTAFQLNSDAAL